MTAFLLAIGSVLVAQVAADDSGAHPGVAAKEAIQDEVIGPLATFGIRIPESDAADLLS